MSRPRALDLFSGAEAARLTKERERAEYALCSLRAREEEAISKARALEEPRNA